MIMRVTHACAAASLNGYDSLMKAGLGPEPAPSNLRGIRMAHRFELPGIGYGVCAKQAPSNSFLNERERLLGVPCFYFSN